MILGVVVQRFGAAAIGLLLLRGGLRPVGTVSRFWKDRRRKKTY